jgi:hypothetical protein
MIPLALLGLAIPQLLPLQQRRHSSDAAVPMEKVRTRLVDMVLPSASGDVVRLSRLAEESALVLCVHDDCEECELLVRLACTWGWTANRTVLIVAPRGSRFEGRAGGVVVAIDQTFEIGRLCGAQQPPVACVIEPESRLMTHVVQGHREVQMLIVGTTASAIVNLTAAESVSE